MDNKHIYLSLKEVAEYLNVSLGYARKIAKDKIGHYRFGCRIYVDKNDLDEWIAAQRNQPQESLPKVNRPKKNPPKENTPKENTSQENTPEENPPKENPSQENLPQENLPQENQPEPKSGLAALLASVEDNQPKAKLSVKEWLNLPQSTF